MEQQNIEWKESWRDEYLKWVCGFANAQGGTLYIGVNDKGKTIGLPAAHKLLREIPNKVRDVLGILVDVNLLEDGTNEYIEIVVEPYPNPINYKGEYHYRSGSTKQELKGASLNKFILQKAGKHWDSVLVPQLSTNNLSLYAFQYFKKHAIKSKRVDENILEDSPEALLENLHLIEDGQYKRATALLFYDNPEKFVTGAYIKIGFFANDADILYQDEVHGCLFEQVDKTMDLLLTKYLRAYISYERINRVEEYPYPSSALREALLNAVAHKDYSSGTPIQIRVYENSLQIWNDGELPTNWNVEKLLGKHSSKPYNPEIANVFFRAGMIESWGRGIFKIIDECKKIGLQAPIFNFDFGGLSVDFIANVQKGSEKSSEEGSEKSSEKILAMMRKNPNITIAELATHLAISTRAIEKQIRKLKTENLITRIGSNKSGQWKIL